MLYPARDKLAERATLTSSPSAAVPLQYQMPRPRRSKASPAMTTYSPLGRDREAPARLKLPGPLASGRPWWRRSPRASSRSRWRRPSWRWSRRGARSRRWPRWGEWSVPRLALRHVLGAHGQGELRAEDLHQRRRLLASSCQLGEPGCHLQNRGSIPHCHATPMTEDLGPHLHDIKLKYVRSLTSRITVIRS